MTSWLVVCLALLLVVAALVALCAAQKGEIRYLRRQLEERSDHRRRIERVESGLTEVKVEPAKPDVPPPGIQSRIDNAIAAWESPITQDLMRQDIRQWRREGKTWEYIADELESDIV